MTYPTHLLPQANFKIIKWHSDLLHLVLVRKTGTSDFYDYEKKLVKAECITISRDELKDFSSNLLGIFKLEDNNYEIPRSKSSSDYYNGLWTEGEQVRPPLINADFDKAQETFCFFLLIKNIYGQKIKYSYKDKPGFEGSCFVKHTPTRANFWHFSVRWCNHNGDDIHRVKENFKPLLSAAKNLIAVNGTPDCPEFPLLSKSHYVID